MIPSGTIIYVALFNLESDGRSPTRIFGSWVPVSAPTYFEQYAARYEFMLATLIWMSKSLGGDLGVEQRLADGHYASVTGFWTRIDDEISTMSVGTWPNSLPPLTNYSLHFLRRGSGVQDSSRTRGTAAIMPITPSRCPSAIPSSKYETIQMAPATARHTINAEVATSPVEKLTVASA